MKPESPTRPRKRRHYMMAMVLGTALSAFGQSAAQAAPAEAIQDISRYCTTCWRNARLPADRWGDCTQEVFRRLLDRVPTDEWNRLLNGAGEERREFRTRGFVGVTVDLERIDYENGQRGRRRDGRRRRGGRHRRGTGLMAADAS